MGDFGLLALDISHLVVQLLRILLNLLGIFPHLTPWSGVLGGTGKAADWQRERAHRNHGGGIVMRTFLHNYLHLLGPPGPRVSEVVEGKRNARQDLLCKLLSC